MPTTVKFLGTEEQLLAARERLRFCIMDFFNFDEEVGPFGPTNRALELMHGRMHVRDGLDVIFIRADVTRAYSNFPPYDVALRLLQNPATYPEMKKKYRCREGSMVEASKVTHARSGGKIPLFPPLYYRGPGTEDKVW